MRFRRWILAVLIISLAVVTLSGCGPSGPVTVSRYCAAEFTGRADYMYNNSTYSWSAALDASGSELVAGSYYSAPGTLYHNFRLLFSFGLNGLTGTQVQTATLKVYLVSVDGTPFTTLGNVLVDPVHFDGTTTAQHLFEDMDLAVNPITGQISNAATGAWKTVDVTDTVQDQIDLGRTYAQFRLGHSGQVFTGNALHESTWGGVLDTNYRPTLEITYTN